MDASMGSTMDAVRAAADKQARATAEKERQARFRAWWAGLTPEQRRAEVCAGHVRVNLPSGPDKQRKPRKRTRAAQARSAEVEEMRAVFGEAYVHATPLQRLAARLRAYVQASQERVA